MAFIVTSRASLIELIPYLIHRIYLEKEFKDFGTDIWIWTYLRRYIWSYESYLWRSCYLVTKEGLGGMGTFCNDTLLCALLIILSELVRSCVTHGVMSPEMLKLFKANCIIQQHRCIWHNQWRSMETTELPVPIFRQLYLNGRHSTIVMWYAYEEILLGIDYFKT